MTTIRDEILLNRYAQSVVGPEIVLNRFVSLSDQGQREFYTSLLCFIGQSKPVIEDVEIAIESSGLKETYTPCVLLRKGVQYNNLLRIVNLPKDEQKKVILLLLSLFRVCYMRRYELEKNDPNKWWYWDLSDDRIVSSILHKYDEPMSAFEQLIQWLSRLN